MELLKLAISAIIPLFVYWLYKRYLNFKVFQRAGIGGPKPNFITGNLTELGLAQGVKPLRAISKWLKEYGPVFGYFVGTTPKLVVTDPEMIKQITIKDFSNFTNRPEFIIKGKPLDDTLLALKDDRWRGLRKLLTPIFTSRKLKILHRVIDEPVLFFTGKVNGMAENGTEFDIYEMCQRLSLDVIGECALAMKINCQNEKENIIFVTSRAIMREANVLVANLTFCFPILAKLMSFFIKYARITKIMQTLVKHLESVLEQRRRLNYHKKSIDMLQLMIDCAEKPEMEEIEPDEELMESHWRTSKSSKTTINDDEIIANCWLFLLGGFESTATTITYLSYLLAVNQDMQDKLYEEIKSKIKDENEITYEEANDLQYLGQLVSETLRMYPPMVLSLERSCIRDIEINGFKIPAGMDIQIPIYHVHHNPDFWPDPEKFNPDRFSPENKAKLHPMAYIPFGAGPRNCLGMRFALMETKLAIIRLVSKYRLLTSAGTRNPPELVVPHVTLVPETGIYLKVEPR